MQGRARTGADDVVIDSATATNYRFTVGDRVLINLPDRPQTFTITGIVTFGCDDNLAGITLAGFSLPTAQAGFNARGSFDTISVLAAPGADTVRLQRAIAAMLPPGVELISGRALVNELSNAVDSELSFISMALVVFGFIALFVGAFTIFNTFSITVGQRTRELALLGVVGASRRQVFRSVLSEAAVTALVASLIGLGLGVLAALGLKALLKAFNIVLPSSPLVFEARTPVVAITVGVGVTVISAILPARRAVRIPAVAALVDHSEGGAASLRRRRVFGGVGAASVGAIAIAAGLTGPAIALVGLGAAAVFIAAGMLAPVVARPLSSVLGRPLSSMLGTPGRLAQEKRDAQPAPHGSDRRRTDGRPGAGVDDRGPRDVPQRSGGKQRRYRDQRQLHHQRQRRVQQVGRARRLAGARGHDNDHVCIRGSSSSAARSRPSRRCPPHICRRRSTCT